MTDDRAWPAHGAALWQIDEDEWLIVHGRVAHALNRSAAVVWSCVEIGATDVAACVAAEFDVPRADVVDAVDHTVGEFVRLGLVERNGVGERAQGATSTSEPTDPADSRVTTPHLRPGLRFPPLLGGASFESPSGPTLLVNWNPSCGYCVSLAPALARAIGDLQMRVVVVASGSAADNEALAESAGLPTTAFVGAPPSDEGPFAGLGTPAMLTFDEDGTASRPLAYGAVECRDLLTQLSGLDLSPEADLPEGLRLLDDGGGGACAPGVATSRERPTLPTVGIRVDDVVVGVRPESDAAATLIDRWLAPDHQVAADGLPTHFTIDVETSAKEHRGVRGLSTVRRGANVVVRSRNPARALLGLGRHVAAAAGLTPDGTVPVSAAVAIHDQIAVLLPRVVTMRLARFQRPTARLGWHIADVPIATVDAASGEVAIPDQDWLLPGLTAAAAAEDHEHDAATPPGRYRIHTWFLARDPELLGPLSTAQSIAAAAPLATRYDAPVPVEALAGLFASARGHACWFTDPRAMREQIGDELRRIASS